MALLFPPDPTLATQGVAGNWFTIGSDESVPEKTRRPYLVFRPLVESANSYTKQSEYDVVAFDFGVADDSFEDASKLMSAVEDAIKNAPLSIPNRNVQLVRLFDARHRDMKTFWIIERECRINLGKASNYNPG